MRTFAWNTLAHTNVTSRILSVVADPSTHPGSDSGPGRSDGPDDPHQASRCLRTGCGVICWGHHIAGHCSWHQCGHWPSPENRYVSKMLSKTRDAVGLLCLQSVTHRLLNPYFLSLVRWSRAYTVLPTDAGAAAASDAEAAAGGRSGSPAEGRAATTRTGHGAAEGKQGLHQLSNADSADTVLCVCVS